MSVMIRVQFPKPSWSSGLNYKNTSMIRHWSWSIVISAHNKTSMISPIYSRISIGTKHSASSTAGTVETARNDSSKVRRSKVLLFPTPQTKTSRPQTSIIPPIYAIAAQTWKNSPSASKAPTPVSRHTTRTNQLSANFKSTVRRPAAASRTK